MKKVFHTGEVCEESGVYRVLNNDDISKKQSEIPLAKGERFPPCRNCKDGKAQWELVRKA